MRKQSSTSTLTLRDHIWESIHPSIWKRKGERMKPIHDNTVDLFYVADRLVEILDVDDNNLRKEVEEFRSEIFHNIGANAVHDHNN